jgi:protein gp37
MGINSDIEWCHATLNFWYGCHKVSDGCTYCYMFRDAPRYGRDANVVTRSGTFYDSLKWAKSGKLKPGSRIFVCSWSDFFIEEADDWRGEAWDIIKQTPQFTYLILTKRVDNILDRLPPDWGNGYPNVWLGPTVESDKYLWRIDKILQIPAAKRFVSIEPMLGDIDLRKVIPCPDCEGDGYWHGDEKKVACELCGGHEDAAGHGMSPDIDWVIVGAESGAGRRECKIEWVRDIVGQCEAAEVPVFVKQLHKFDFKGKVSKDMNEWPEDLRVREYPDAT